TSSATPQDVFRKAIQEAGMRGGAPRESDARARIAARAEAARHNATAPDLRGTPDARPAPPREPVRRMPPPPPPPPPEAENYVEYEAEEEYLPASGYRLPAAARAETRGDEPRLAPEYDQDQGWEDVPPPPPPGGRGGDGPKVDKGDRLAFAQKRRGRGYVDAEIAEDDLGDAKPKRSRLPGIILTVLIIGVVGGLAALGWSQRAILTDLLASFESSEPPTLSEAPADGPSETSKNADRLLASDQPADPNVRVVGGDDEAGSDMEAMPGADVVPAVPASADAGASPDALVAQKAILYEEPVGDAGDGAGVTAINAAVTWRFIEDGPNGPEVEARLDVPERDMTVRFTFHKNQDATLPASHLIEVTVDTPANFPGQGVNEVPRVVLKSSEEERGQPLVGAAAKVADGFFWIALSANQNDIAANVALLRARNWIDLPFVYGTGQRAILTFEKGTPGERVFEEAFAAWGTG
ncbi:MAG: hypothetical protein KDJ86_11415, partial [Bauldia sp.]|uniref:hypothetical protein n=1 Tax=Bauldia sp. TaxID=2575872 RepID=UPI001DA6A8AF